MGNVTAADMDVVTKGSGHTCVGMAVSVCTTPAAPSPIPIPYPLTGSVSEGITDASMRTKIGGDDVMTVGSCMTTCHGNEPGTLKEVVSMNTTGPCCPLVGAPNVINELGLIGITGSPALMNKAITEGGGGSASDAGGGAGGGGGGGGGGGAGGPSGPSSPSSAAGSASSSSTSAAAAPSSDEESCPVKVTQQHRDKANKLLRGKCKSSDVALAEADNLSEPPPREQINARKRVASAFYRSHAQENAMRDDMGREYGKNPDGSPIKHVRPATHAERASQLNGIDYNKPVRAGPPPACESPVHQCQPAGNDRGNYFDPGDSTPDQLGIYHHGKAWNQPGQPVVKKTRTQHNIDPSTPHLQSTAAPADDTWSIPGETHPTNGGGTQNYVPAGCDPNSGLVQS